MSSPPIPPQRPRFLRVVAAFAVLLLVVGWVCMVLGMKVQSYDLVTVYFGAHFGAFIIGIMSFERMGGIAAMLAAVTMTGWFIWLGMHPVGS